VTNISGLNRIGSYDNWIRQKWGYRFPALRALTSQCLWLAVAFSLAAPGVRASTADVVADFSDTANPNGVWSYYYGATLYSAPSQTSAACIGTGTLCWQFLGGIPDDITVGQNNTGSTKTFGTISVPTGYAFLDPESLGATILFTAASTGSYTISGNFRGVDTSENSHPVEILDNGLSVFSSTISTFGGTAPFSFGESLSAGDKIAFEVLTGSTGCTYCDLSTGLQATITPESSAVPEPSSVFMCMGAAAIIVLRARRRLSRSA
jgi:hypothetical protein